MLLLWHPRVSGVIPPAPTVVTGGAGHPINWQGKRRRATLADKPNEHLRQILDRVVAEYYAEIVESDLPTAIKQEAAAAVRPFAERKARHQAIPQALNVDWARLQHDAGAVGAILRIWHDEIAQEDIDDDETILLLMQ